MVPSRANSIRLHSRSRAGSGKSTSAEQPPSPGASKQADLAGSYKEKPPRNLKPLLRHPVMAAIQSAPRHRIVVRRSKEGFVVSIPEAAVEGKAKSLGGGLYKAVLKRSADALDCKLRLINGGRGLILYLSDAPFHQVTYERS